MSLRGRYNEKELDLLVKHLHMALCGKEDNKLILYLPLQLPLDKVNHIRGAC